MGLKLFTWRLASYKVHDIFSFKSFMPQKFILTFLSDSPFLYRTPLSIYTAILPYWAVYITHLVT